VWHNFPPWKEHKIGLKLSAVLIFVVIAYATCCVSLFTDMCICVYMHGVFSADLFIYASITDHGVLFLLVVNG